MIDTRGRSCLAILGAVPFETDPLLDHLDQVRSLPLLEGSLHSGLCGTHSVIVGSTGLGKVNAAITTAIVLERFPVGMVWNAGCAGAFEEGPLNVGDVLVAKSAICGDEGVLTKDRLLSTAHIGIPVLMDGEIEYYDNIPLDRKGVMEQLMGVTPEGLYRLAGADRAAVRSYSEPSSSFRLRYGPSLTVGMVSGDVEIAHDRFLRYGAYAENMEGSAVAQACFRFGVPMVECRGISNMAGNRHKADWRLHDAISHCHGIMFTWLGNLAHFEKAGLYP